MSDLNKIARPYAKAIFELAAGDKNLPEWQAKLEQLAKVCNLSDMKKILMNPSLDKSIKQNLILQTTKLEGDKQIESLIFQLGAKNKILLLPTIYKLYLDYKNRHDGVMTVELISAFALKNAQIEVLRKALEKKYAKKMELTVKQDADLIGGAIIRIGNMVIDNSLKGRLKKLKEILHK